MNKIISITFFLILLSVYSCNNQKKNIIQVDPNSNNIENTLLENIKQFKDSILLKENLIQFYRDGANYKTAISNVNEYIKHDSINPRLWNMKAVLHFENGDTIESIQSFEKEMQLMSNTTDTIALATLYAETKNKKALAIADALLENYKQNFQKQAWFIKGLYYSYVANKTEAIVYFDKCISLDYTFMEAYREKAIALYDKKQYNNAISVLNKAVTIQNGFDEGYFYLGKCYEKIEDHEKAREAYQKAILYNADYEEAKKALKKLMMQQ